MKIIRDSISVLCLYIINIKSKNKVDHCDNDVGLTSIPKYPTWIRRMKSLLYRDEAYALISRIV